MKRSLLVLVVLLACCWGPAFSSLKPLSGVRARDQFLLISQRISGLEERYSPRPRLFNLSDRMEPAMGRISSPKAPWAQWGSGSKDCRVTISRSNVAAADRDPAVFASRSPLRPRRFRRGNPPHRRLHPIAEVEQSRAWAVALFQPTDALADQKELIPCPHPR